MEYMEFVRQIIKDLRNEFDVVKMDGKNKIYVAKDVTNVSIPTKSMYQEYQFTGYKQTFKNYMQIINDILNTYRFKLDLNNVFPFVKSSEFGKDSQQDFISEKLFCNLSLFWVADMGEVFRFITKDDLANSNIDIDTLKTKSFENLNKITNILAQLDKTLPIYSLRFNTDYAATLFLSKYVQEQIQRKVGDDILFCMPSSSTFICAKYQELTFNTYSKILKHLITIDNDVNKISDKIYRQNKDGTYTIVA